MKKFVKIASIAAVVVLLAAVVAPMALRGRITETVKREANDMLRARLDFEKLDISLLRHFPHASIELKGLTLVGAERFEGDTILASKRISVVVNLLSLFGDEGLKVSKIYVNAPRVHARKLEDGAVNWDVMKPLEPRPSESPEAEPSAFRLSVRDLRITNAAIRYEDDSTGMRFSTSPASLRLRGDLSASKTDLNLKLDAEDMHFVSGGVPLLNGAEGRLEAVIEADLAKKRYVFSKNKLRLNAISLSLDGWVQLLSQGLSVDLKAGCEQVQFKELLSLVPVFYTKDFGNLSASGELAMSLWVKGTARESMLPAFEMKTTVKQGSFQYSSLPKAVTDIELALSISNPGGSMDQTAINLSKCAFNMVGNRVSATLYASNLVTDPLFRAAVEGHVDLKSIGKVYPLEDGVELKGEIAADMKVSARMSDVDQRHYEQIAASGNLVVSDLGLAIEGLPAVHIRRAAASITPATMTLGEFGVRVGRSDLSATGQLSGYIGYALRGERLSGRLYVKSEQLDLNEFMGLCAADSVAAASTTPAGSTAAAHPFDVPRNLNLSLATELHEVLFQKMTISGVKGEMRVDGGAVSLENLEMKLFGGTATASGSYSTAVDTRRPALKMNLGVSGASFSRTFEELEMVQKLVPLFAKTGGSYSLSLDLATTLDAQMTPDLKTLNASGEIRSANIKLQNLAFLNAFSEALDNKALRGIEAKDVAIRFAICDGRITTQPFDLRVAGYKINLSGSTGLDQTIDYAARVSLPESATGGLLTTVGMTIGGTFSDPKITLGLKEAAQEAVKNALNKQIEKLTGSKSLSAEVRKQIERLREESQKAGVKLVEAAETQRTRLVEAAAAKGALAKFAAQKAGDKLVEEAGRQAENLKAETERQIEKLAGSKTSRES